MDKYFNKGVWVVGILLIFHNSFCIGFSFNIFGGGDETEKARAYSLNQGSIEHGECVAMLAPGIGMTSGLEAFHDTLPRNSRVIVKNASNRKQITVTITGRPPISTPGRILVLSPEAFGMITNPGESIIEDCQVERLPGRPAVFDDGYSSGSITNYGGETSGYGFGGERPGGVGYNRRPQGFGGVTPGLGHRPEEELGAGLGPRPNEDFGPGPYGPGQQSFGGMRPPGYRGQGQPEREYNGQGFNIKVY